MVEANKGKRGGVGVGCGDVVEPSSSLPRRLEMLPGVCVWVSDVVGWSHRSSLLRGLGMLPAGGARVSSRDIAPAHEEGREGGRVRDDAPKWSKDDPREHVGCVLEGGPMLCCIAMLI